MFYFLIWFYIHPFIHPFVDDAQQKCNVRAHPRIAALKRVFPSRPRATLCFSMLWTASLARDRGHFVWLHQQPASSEHSLIVKLGWYSAHHKLRSVTFAPVYHYRIMSRIAVLIDPARMAEPDNVHVRCYRANILRTECLTNVLEFSLVCFLIAEFNRQEISERHACKCDHG